MAELDNKHGRYSKGGGGGRGASCTQMFCVT